MSALVLGLDIGGSKTHALLCDGETVLEEVFAGSANPSSAGIAEAIRQLDLIFAQLHTDEVRAICAGAAGVDTTEGEERFRRLLTERAPTAQVSVVHDTALILATAGTTTGTAVISGTGSVAWGRRSDGYVARAGGWGYLLGDEGSGYWVTREAVRHALLRTESGRSADKLSQQLAADCGLQRVEQLVDHFYANPERRYWASRARIVFEHAAAGDQASSRIVSAAAEALAALVYRVGQRLGSTGPVVLAGGLVVNQPALQQAVRERLSRQGRNDVRVLDRAPAYGAVSLAQALLGYTADDTKEEL